ncbi:MAG: hypothetical protein LUC22_06575, partial [Prevotella sp.]|nr:hypothetical protein [Prevotella sp.]
MCLRFALFGSTGQEVKEGAVSTMLSALHRRGAETLIDRPFAERLVRAHIPTGEAKLFSGDDFTADFAVSIGGDGTFLHTASRIVRK